MNFCLKFHQKALKKKYEDYLLKRSFSFIVLIHLGIIGELIYCKITMTISIISDSSEYLIPGKESEVYFLIIGVSWLIFFIISSCYNYIKKKGYSDISLILSFFYFLNLARNILQNPLYSFETGYFFTILNVIFLTAYRTFFIKMIHMISNLIFYITIVQISEKYHNGIMIHSIIFTILILIMFYFMEKGEKTIFLNAYSFEKDKKTLSDILNVLPEGLAIFSKDLSSLIINDSLKLLYGEQNQQKLQEKIFKENKIKNSLGSGLAMISCVESINIDSVVINKGTIIFNCK